MKNTWRLSVLGGLAALCSALSCSGDRTATSDSVATLSQELTATQARVFGFENVAGSGGDWAATSAKIQSGTPHVEGSKSAAFAVTATSAKITSIALSSLGPITNQVTLSVWLPAYVAGLSYQGQVGLRLNSTTAGVFNQYYGPVVFNNAPTGTWRQISFTLPAADANALSTRTYSDLVASIDLAFNPNPAFNPNNPFADPGYVDALTFGSGSAGSGGAGGASGASGSAGKGGVSGASGTAGRAGGSGSGGTSGASGSAGRAGSSGSAGRAGSGGTSGASGSGGRAGSGAASGASGSAGSSGNAGTGGSGTAGPCIFSPPPASTPNTQSTFTIQLPHGVPRESVGLSTAGGSLTLDDGVQVVKDGTGFASVSSVGATSRTTLGVSALVQDAYSEPLGIDLRSNAHVYGVLKTAADLTKQAGAGVDGVVSQNTSLKPLDVISWVVAFPNLNRGTCSIEPDNVQTIDPASYGDIAVKARSHLKLRSGSYYFTSLNVDSTAFLDIDNTAGPVFIYVKNTFNFSGSVVEADRNHMNILFGVASATPIAIQTAFRGVLVAPQASVALPTDMTAGHVGAFFARSLIAHQNTAIHQRPFTPDEFCAPDAACSTFCPCIDGGSCTIDNQCRNGHSCVSGQCACVPSCAGKTCGQGNGCDDKGCPGLCGNGGPCDLDSDCVAGSLCNGQVCEPTGTHCTNGVKDRDESDVDCGGADCGRCNHGKTCTETADCISGDECPPNNNSECFGKPRGQRICWPAQCGDESSGGTAYDCGSQNSLCGKSCACGGCDDKDPNTVCPPGEICKDGIRQTVDGKSGDACVDPRCPTDDPALCGTDSSVCGPTCVPTPHCATATCANPGDGADGICSGVCKLKDPCHDDIACGVGLSCILGASGVATCQPSSCAFQLCGQASPLCPDLCPECTKACDGRQCGPDPHCGKSCGECGGTDFCSVAGKCVKRTVPGVLKIPDGNNGTKDLPDLPPQETNPVGALPGQFSVSEQGSPVYNIPIEVPPGRAGMEPALSLQYSGSRTNADVGVGWHLEGLSKITRCPRNHALDGATGPVQNNSTDRFCIDGKRLESISGTYGGDGTEYRTLIDSFAKVVSHIDALPMIQADKLGNITPVPPGDQGPDSFVVWTKDGRKLTYGGTYDATVLAHTNVRFAWFLNRVEDRAGNTLLVSYSNLAMGMPNSQAEAPYSVAFPRAIAYTGHTGDPEIDGNREVHFDYEARTDPQTRFTAGGAPFIVAQRLSRITTFVNKIPVKNYHLQYSANELSQVEKIYECAGGDDSHCKPPTTFGYAHTGGFYPDAVGFNVQAAGQLDMNGDGRPDFMATNMVVDGVPAQPTLKAATIISDVAISAAAIALDAAVGPEAGFALSFTWDILKGPFWGMFAKEPTITFQHELFSATGNSGSNTFGHIQDVQGLRCGGSDHNHPAFMLDYDQDGRDDVVSACGTNEGSLYVALSSGNGSFVAYPSNNAAVATVPIGVGTVGSGRGATTKRLAGPILIDVNGDGLQDIVSCPSQYTVSLRLRRPPPEDFETTPINLSTAIPPDPPPHVPPTPRKLQILCGTPTPTYNSVDIDGDGTPDLLAYSKDNNAKAGWFALHVSFADGKGALNWQPVEMPVTAQSNLGKNLNVGDFNGDGLADVFGSDDKQYTIWLNTGGNRFYTTNIARPKPPLPQSSGKWAFGRIAVLDYNTFGRDNFLENWETSKYDLGSGTVASDNFNWALTPSGDFLPNFGTAEVPSIERAWVGGIKHPASFLMTADINADGHTDLLARDSVIFYGSGDISLNRITDGLGKVVEINYGNTATTGYTTDGRCTPGTPGSTWPDKCLPRMNGIVTGHSEGTLDSFGNFSSERIYKYSYVNGRMNLTGHGWLGFDRRQVTFSSTGQDGAGTTTTIDYEPVARYTPSGQPATDLSKPYIYPFAGLPRTTTVDNHVPGIEVPPLQSDYYERRIQTINEWQVEQSSFNRPFPVVSARTTSAFERQVQGGLFPGPPRAFEDNGALLNYCRHDLTTDVYGNLVDDSEDCYVGTMRVESTHTVTDFSPDPLTWLISNPDHVKSVNYHNGLATRESRFTYSGGLLKTVTRAPDDTQEQWRQTTYVRDDFGNVKQIVEAVNSEPSRTTDITYDSDEIFPSTITNAAGQTTQIRFESSWGSRAGLVDPNGVAVQFGHDGFGRLTRREGSDGVTVSTYSNIAQPNPTTAAGTIAPKIKVRVERTGTEGSSDGATTTEYDAYGRPVRTTSTGFAGAQVIQERVYDSIGRLSANTLPHIDDPQKEVPYDSYSYEDNLRRLTRVYHSDGSFRQYQYASTQSIKSDYYQWFRDYSCGGEDVSGCAADAMRTIDEELHENVVIADHNGQTIRNVDGENTSNTLHTSNYVYGPFNKLIEARDNLNFATEFVYDDYGRLLTRTDPDTGDSIYTYNGFDELHTSNDPKQQLRTYNHDSLGRIESILDSQGLTQWIYDQGPGALGRLSESLSPSGQNIHYNYEPATGTHNRGYLQSVSYAIEGAVYPITLDYDDLGRTSRIHYPTTGTGQPVVAEYKYDSSGILYGLDEIGSGTAQSLWRLTDVFQGHLIQNETFGNGTSATHTTHGYNDARRWLEHVKTTLGTEEIQTLDYTYDTNGLVHSLAAKDSSPREYQYDALNRLSQEIISAGPLGSLVTQYQYDEIGNLVTRGSMTNTYLPNQPHLLDGVGGNSYHYDANGNVSDRSGPDVPGEHQLISYAPFDLPSTIQTPNSNDNVFFDYSADAVRVLRQDSDGTVRHFVADLYQQTLDSFGATQEEHFRLFAGDRQIAEIARKDGADQTLYFHPDHLGSPETISDSNGAAYHQHFDPFGKPLDTPNPEITRVGFTGHDHDNDLGLIDMKGRVYDPLAGRFMTADPVTQAPFWSQGSNRYSYVFNNPINNTDPSGFDARGGDLAGIVMGWGGAVTGIAALQGFSVSAGAIAGGLGIGALNPVTSALSGTYGLFDGSAGSSQSVAAPTAAPKGSGVGRDSTLGASGQNKGGVGTAWRAAFDALHEVIPASVANNQEYGGLIYRLHGLYFATPAVTTGSENAVEVWDARPDVPSGADIVGDYHTHPHTVEGDPRWWRNGETFSGLELPYYSDSERFWVTPSLLDASDYYGAKLDLSRPGVDRNAFTSFVSTPSGRFGVYSVQRDTIFYFSPNSQLLPPGESIPAASYAYH